MSYPKVKFLCGFRFIIKNSLISRKLYDNIETLPGFNIFFYFSRPMSMMCYIISAALIGRTGKKIRFIHLCTKKIRKPRGTINIWNLGEIGIVMWSVPLKMIALVNGNFLSV